MIWLQSNWHLIFLGVSLVLGTIAFYMWWTIPSISSNNHVPARSPVRDTSWRPTTVAPVKSLPTIIQDVPRSQTRSLEQALLDNRVPARLTIHKTPANVPLHQQIPITTLPFTLGRLNCDLNIKEPRISRKHAQIVQKDERFYLVDLHSSNLTFLGGRQITPGELIPLPSNATITLGRRTVLKFEA